MKCNRLIISLVPLLLAFGCKKSETHVSERPQANATQAGTSPEANSPAAPGTPATEAPVSSQQAALDPATETPPNPTETEENPDSEEKTEPLPRMLPNQDSTEPIAIPRPPPQTLCLRACNKAQMCGTASGSVAACVTACLASLEATDGDGKQQAIGFRAQERCADKACNLFEDCVGRVLVGERALAEAPPLSPNEAAQRCDRLCKKEQECSPERFSQRPGGMSTCLSTCANMLISPADDIAVRRVLMNKAYGCLDKPCDEFQPCVQSAMTAR